MQDSVSELPVTVCTAGLIQQELADGKEQQI